MNHLLLYVAVNGFLIPFGDAAPSFTGDRMLVPMRPVFQKMKAVVRNVDDKVIVEVNDKTLTMQAGARNFLVDGLSYQLPVAPQKSKMGLLIPLRSVMEALGAQVFYSNRFGSYRFIGITVPTTPIFKSPYRNHFTYSPEWLFKGRNVTLNATVKRFLSSNEELFEAITEDGIPLKVYAHFNVNTKPATGKTLRMSGYLVAGDGTFKAHDTGSPEGLDRFLKNSGIVPIPQE